LFVERVRDVRPDFQLTSTNGPLVAAICRRLDALPLALELAAPWMKVLTAEDLLHRLKQNALAPPATRQDLPERQRTMNETVAWSYQLLDAHEQRAFRRLGVLTGRFSLQAAAAALTDPAALPSGRDHALAIVASLIDKSLLARADASLDTRPLYEMFETVRGYAASELRVDGERNDVLEGLARYATAEATEAVRELTGPAQPEWLDRVRDELGVYRMALGWLVERGRPAEAADIAYGLMFFWLIRGHGAEGLQWYERILEQTPVPPAAESKCLLGSAIMAYTRGDVGRARTRLTCALERAQAAGESEVLVQAEHLCGYLELASGNLDAARQCFTRSAAGFRALAIPWGTGNALIGLASVALRTGDAAAAEPLLDEATSTLRHAGPWFLNLPLYLRAILAVTRGNPDQAIAAVRESVTRSRQLHDRFAFVYALVPLAAAAVLKGHDGWAARILGARDAVTERTGAVAVDPSVRALRQRAEEDARARLGPELWSRAYTAGRRASIDSLLDDIDRVLASA
jgi:hypothetical protein